MSKEHTKDNLVKSITNKLESEKIVIGGNRYLYKKKYHLKYTQEIVNNVLTAFLEEVEDIIESGDSVKFSSYFKLKPKFINEKSVGNPRKPGERISVPGHYKVTCFNGKKLKEACKHLLEHEGER